ncbi:MAG: replication initiation protein [Lachnospiraceae bacterium]|nr:replication initiation protein [Lachnospiraceae bacterium]
MSKEYTSQNQLDANQLIVRKSAEFTKGKYAVGTAFALNLVNICTTRLSVERDGTLSASLTPGEIREIFQTNDNVHIYNKLKGAAKELTGGNSVASKSIFLEDGKGNFKSFVWVTNADYVNGVFKITFNKEMKKHLVDLKTPFLSYQASNTIKIKNPYIIRLYEILRTERYKIDYQKTPEVDVVYGIAELRFSIGLDVMDSKMGDAREAGASWEELEDMVPENLRKYWGWKNFKNQIIDPAQKAFKENTDIAFEYKTIRQGKGGKTTKIRFFITKNSANADKIESQEKRLESVNDKHFQMTVNDLDLPEELHDYIGHNRLEGSDLAIFLKDANGDIDKVIRYIDMADNTDSSVINNYVGWIRDAIRSEYAEPVGVISGSADRFETVSEVTDGYKKEKKDPNSALYKRLWIKATKKEGFEDFLREAEMTREMMEQFYSTQECVENFMSWSKGEGMNW